MSKKQSNQSQEATDMENRNYDAPAERAPRLDLRRDSAPVRDPDLQSAKLQKRDDLGGTSVYKKKLKERKQGAQGKQPEEDYTSSGRNLAGFTPKKENFEQLVKIEAKLDVCLKFLSAAMHDFYALKSIDISADGQLGGRGFVLPIPEIRARLHQAVDSVSGLIDTLYDETRGEHWNYAAPTEEEIEQEVPADDGDNSEEVALESAEEPMPEHVKVSSIMEHVRKKAGTGK